MAKITVLPLPSLETLLSKDFGKLLEAAKKLPNAQIWLKELENPVKASVEKFGENFVNPFANIVLTEID